MKINLIDTYFIETDSYNYILRQHHTTTDEAGNTFQRVRDLGYYPTVDSALKGFVRQESLRSEDELTVNEYITRTERLVEQIEVKLKEAAELLK